MNKKRSLSLRESHAQLFTNALYAFTFELAEQQSYEYSLVTRFPFFDQRLAEFCLSLPHDQKLNGGFTRMVLRRAMEGVLPVEVQWRPGKSNLEPHFTQTLQGSEHPLLLQILAGLPGQLAEYVDVKMLGESCARFLRREEEGSRFFESAWPAITLGTWLQRGSQERPEKGGIRRSMAGTSPSG